LIVIAFTCFGYNFATLHKSVGLGLPFKTFLRIPKRFAAKLNWETLRENDLFPSTRTLFRYISNTPRVRKSWMNRRKPSCFTAMWSNSIAFE